MLIALIPNVAEGLNTSLALVAGAITAYMVPFAALQLVSGTLASRLGPRRVVRASYLVYGCAALVCAFSPSIWVFLGGRALMGAANAFLSPILLAALSEVVAPEVLGRSVGTFAAWQAAGVTFAPAIGGALGEVSWRLAFVLVAVVSTVLALPRRSLGAIEQDARGEGGFRSLANRWIALLGSQSDARLPRVHSDWVRGRARRRSGVRARLGTRGASSPPGTASARSPWAGTQDPQSTGSGGPEQLSRERSPAPPESSRSPLLLRRGASHSSTLRSDVPRHSRGPD